MTKHFYDHAIVIGGSIAGLLAARVLTEHFKRVTIIERDTLPDTPNFRKGVPQAHHPHILLKRGELIMERLFPGLVDQLQVAGGVQVNIGRDIRWFSFGEWRPNYDSGLITIACSRPLLESTIYQRLAAY